MSYEFKYADLLDDEVFKLVFGRESTKDVMIEFLNQVIPDRKIVDLEFIDKEISESAREIVRAAVDAVRSFSVESVIITDNDGWKTKISLNKDGYLVFDPKKTISKKTEF